MYSTEKYPQPVWELLANYSISLILGYISSKWSYKWISGQMPYETRPTDAVTAWLSNGAFSVQSLIPTINPKATAADTVATRPASITFIQFLFRYLQYKQK